MPRLAGREGGGGKGNGGGVKRAMMSGEVGGTAPGIWCRCRCLALVLVGAVGSEYEGRRGS